MLMLCFLLYDDDDDDATCFYCTSIYGIMHMLSNDFLTWNSL